MKAVLFTLAAVMFSFGAFALNIESSVFANRGYIPDRYTCDAQDFSPPLIWADIPSSAKSLVLLCDDPDAPYKVWNHWVLFNIPPEVKGLKEAISKEELIALGITPGVNDFGKIGYGGPCPPQGAAHRYSFNLYALDTILTLEEGTGKKAVIEAMQGHIITEASTVGLYQRKTECESCQKKESHGQDKTD